MLKGEGHSRKRCYYTLAKTIKMRYNKQGEKNKFKAGRKLSMENNKFEQMSEFHDEIISEEKCSIINDLSNRWHDLSTGLWEDEFDIDEFKSLLAETILVLHEFVCDVMPIEIVNLLLQIKQFQQSPQIDDDSGVAIYIARYLCETEYYCNIDEEEDEGTQETRIFLEIWGKTTPHNLYIDALDFDELIGDIDL